MKTVKIVDLNKMGRREENNKRVNPEDTDNYSFYENEKKIEINKEPQKWNNRKKTIIKREQGWEC